MKKGRFPGLRMILIFLAVAALVLTVQPAATLAKKGGGGGGGTTDPPSEPPPPAETPTTPEGICDCAGTAGGVYDPAADPDGDGINNERECLGLHPDPETEPDVNLEWPGFCDQDQLSLLDPTEPNVFATLANANEVDPTGASQTLIQFPDVEAFECLSREQAGGGLGLTVEVVPYVLAEALPDRWVIENQLKLLWIQESLADPPPVPALGKCDNSWGTPNTAGKCWIYTAFINRDVNSKVKSGGIAQDNQEGTTFAEVYQNHYRNTICHELAHSLKLRKLCVYETNCHHWTVEDMVYVSQFIDYRPKGPTTTFYFGWEFFSPADLEDFVVWEPQF
jgi:hypothetical protein